PSAVGHILGNRGLGDLEPKLQQLSMNTWSTPQRVLLAHLSDEFTQFAGHTRPARSATGFPAPIGSKACSMPAQNSVRLNYAGQTKQVWPRPCHVHQKRSVDTSQPKTARRTPHSDIELMAQIQVLDFKPTWRLEAARDKESEQVKQGN